MDDHGVLSWSLEDVLEGQLAPVDVKNVIAKLAVIDMAEVRFEAVAGRTARRHVNSNPGNYATAGQVQNAFRGRWGRRCPEGPEPRCPLGAGPESPGRQDRFTSPACALTVKAFAGRERAEDEKTCDVPIASPQLEATAGYATTGDCAAWSGQQASPIVPG